jgi:4-hydroxy-4-methyl-2-oxoglutarate aldolase
MAITVRKLPPVLETWFLDEARVIPTAFFVSAGQATGFLGPRIRKLTGEKIMAGWALPVTCPPGENLATFIALEFMKSNIGKGRWVLIVSQDETQGNIDTGMWSYMQTAMGWEVGLVGAVLTGYARDLEEITDKLGKEFNVFGWGGSPIKPGMVANGAVGEPVIINGVTIRAGDLIVGDSDGVVSVPRDQVEQTIEMCRQDIVDHVNKLQMIREGHGPIEVLELEKLVEGNVDWEE